MTRQLWLMALAGLFAAMIAAACGSGGGGSPAASGTPSAEREYRQASIMQQQADAAREEQSGARGTYVITDSGQIDFGHRIGLEFSRNVLGDPDAPVLIVEYSDFL